MSVERNRNCNCGYSNNNSCGCQNEEYDNNYSNYNNYSNSCEKTERTVDCDLRREMIQEIRCLDFAITELALYLDTHPEDERALCLHRKYVKEAKELKDKYQKVYGPLTINFPCNKWRWLEEPWASFK